MQDTFDLLKNSPSSLHRCTLSRGGKMPKRTVTEQVWSKTRGATDRVSTCAELINSDTHTVAFNIIPDAANKLTDTNQDSSQFMSHYDIQNNDELEDISFYTVNSLIHPYLFYECPKLSRATEGITLVEATKWHYYNIHAAGRKITRYFSRRELINLQSVLWLATWFQILEFQYQSTLNRVTRRNRNIFVP